TNTGKHYVAGPEPQDWLVSKEEWIDDVIIAIRDDVIIHGTPPRQGFLLLSDGGHVYLNDPTAIAELGPRIHHGMNAVAYAELLVHFHTYSSAERIVLTAPGELRLRYGRNDLPDNEPMRLQPAPDGAVLTFDSSSYAGRGPIFGLAPVVGLMKWTVW